MESSGIGEIAWSASRTPFKLNEKHPLRRNVIGKLNLFQFRIVL